MTTKGMVPSPGGEVLIRAPAKINLGLAVLGKRPDGYHEIETLFQAVSLYDSLAVRRLKRKAVRLRAPDFRGRERENLCWQAAEIFLGETGLPGGLEVELAKRIPAGGGLGGGSSDAAAVLLGACRLYGIRPSAMEMARWASRLGSDVPFFLSSGAAVGTGRGEVVEPLSSGVPRCGLLIYAPGFELSTPEVYGALDPAGLTPSRRRFTMLVNSWKKGDAEALGKRMFNDLEEVALKRFGELRDAKTALASGALGAMVSGSGSSIFALYDDGATARAAAGRLRGRLPGTIRTAHFLSQRHHWGVVKR